MEEVEQKFQRELKKDCTIVACRFPLPSIAPIKTIGEGVDTVWIYKTPLSKNKTI
uniref:Uncharacterized protein n=1 Tax=Bracon brevicornis TaxID=1563983 RepID=A0A6V7K276_9HYME